MNCMDEERFEQKYNEYGEMLYRIAFLFVANESDAEDILQEVFMKLLYEPPEFKSGEHEKAWLIKVTQNKCKNLLKAAHRKNLSINELIIPGVSADDDLRMDVLRQIILLPLKYKSAVILYYYNDYSVEQIAKALHITRSAVKMRLKKGREILKKELEEYGHEEKLL